MTNIGRIRQLAKEKGVKLSYISDSFGLARTYFASVEQRKATIPPDRLGFIAGLLDTTPEYLNGLTDVREISSTQSKPMLNETESAILSEIKMMSEEKKKQVLSYVRFLSAANDTL